MRCSSSTFRSLARLLQENQRGLASALPGAPLLREPIVWSFQNLYSLNLTSSNYTTSPGPRFQQENEEGEQAQSSGRTSKNEIERNTTSSSPSSPAGAPLPAGQLDFNKRQMVMVFTCAKCEVRAAKAFSKVAYTEGVVLIECPGCNSRHLIADHLGWFGTKGNLESFAAEKGNVVFSRLADNTLELTPEDVAGLSDTSDKGRS